MLEWYEKIIDCHRCGSNHAFILTPNIHDIVLDINDIQGFRPFLCRQLSQEFGLSIAYTPSRGYALYVKGQSYSPADPLPIKSGVRMSMGAKPEASSVSQLHAAVGQWFKSVTGLDPLRARPENFKVDENFPHSLVGWERLLTASLRRNSALRENGVTAAVLVIENAQYIVPKVADGGARDSDRLALEMLCRWAYERSIVESGNMVILLADELGALSSAVTSGNSGYRVISVPFPDARGRHAALDVLRPPVTAPASSACGIRLDNETIAAHATGLRLADLEEIVRREVSGEPITYRAVQEKKRSVLEGLCHGAIEIVEPTFGLDRSRAQTKATTYLRRLAEMIKREQHASPQDRCPFIPKGILFVGPPGNGKTHLTMGFASDCGMNMVRFKTLRSMWVGESERNLENVLQVLPALKPVVVFVDEIDQMFSARGAGGTSTGGGDVEKHLLARMLSFMGDDRHRGEILWIGATNRPDLLDTAILRRFDRVIPFMNPTAEERAGLLGDLTEQFGLTVCEGDGFGNAIARMDDFTCDAIQKVVRHSCDRKALADGEDWRKLDPQGLEAAIDDFMPNHDRGKILFMSLHALSAVSYKQDLPWTFLDEVPEDMSDVFRSPEPADGSGRRVIEGIDRLKIEEKLRTLAREINW